MIENPDKVMIAGDWHGSGHWGQAAIHHAHKGGAKAIVHAGDFGFGWVDHATDRYLRFLHQNLEECDLTLYWVDGNHENHDAIQEARQGSREPMVLNTHYPRIIHLPRGYRWEWNGKTWMAVGGAVSVDRLLRTEGKSWWAGEVLSDEDVEFASRPGSVDYIVSHDCPYGVDIPGIGPWDKGGDWPPFILLESEDHRRQLKKVVDAVKPKAIFHGHYHRKYHNLYRGEGFDSLVVGLDCDGSSLEENTLFIDTSNSA